jgi:DNA repair protein RadA/Sms
MLNGVLCPPGQGPKTAELPLYGAERLAGLKRGAVVYVTEGEPCADALEWAGVLAVATVTGANGLPCDASLKPLASFQVRLWADNDTAGVRHMRRVAEHLKILGCPDVETIVWDDAPANGDAADFCRPFAQRNDAAAARKAVEDLPRTRWELRAAKGTVAVEESNAADLIATDEPDLESLPVFGQTSVVIRGWAHIVAGAPKAGKTTFLAHIVRDWLDLGFLVLWLTEEPRSVWRRRLRRLEGDWGGLTLCWGDPSQEAALRQRAADGIEGIVILDTIRQFLPVKDWNDAGHIAAAVRPWVATVSRATGKTLLLGHHARKGGGEHGEEIAGSHELFAAVDVGISLKYDGEEKQRRRRLITLGREIEPTVLLYEMAGDEKRSLRCLGDPEAVGRIQVQERVLATLNGRWLNTLAVRAQLKEPQPSNRQVLYALTELAKANRIDRNPPIEQPAQGVRLYWHRSPAQLRTAHPSTSG